MTFRIGQGYDNHQLIEGRTLVLGGIEIPAPVGEDAHSDGDVLIHALVDALLGAMGAGDIGSHFPDSDPQWRGQSSHLFLERVATMAEEKGYSIVNIDATIVLEKIRLGDWKAAIKESVRKILAPKFQLPEDAVNIKAKTNERCDAVGEGKAIVAYVTVLMEKGSV